MGSSTGELDIVWMSSALGIYMIASIWLVLLIAGLAAWTWIDARQYAAFKLVQDSAERRAAFMRWAGQSFIILTGASVITFLILGRFDAPFGIPAEFQPLSQALQSENATKSADGAVGFAIGLAIGISILVATQIYRIRKSLKPVMADVEPMIPRNGKEMLAVLPLCVNAGFSEELLFRLALPLLIAQVTGSVAIAFVGSTLIFGLVHAYQGWKGVVATALVGGLFVLIYLSRGSLLHVMILHALIDVIALIVRPAIAKKIASMKAPTTSSPV